MATNTPILGLKKPVPNVEENWAFRINESLDILDQSLLVGNASSTENVTTYNDGDGHLLISGSTNPVFDHVEALTFNSPYITVATGTFTDVLGEQVIAASGIFDDVVVNGVSLTTQTPVDNSFKLVFNVEDRKGAGVAGGTFTSGAWRVRTLNNVVTNDLPSASLSANTMTLGPGNYYIEWSAPAYKVNRHQSLLENITNPGIVMLGSSEYTSQSYNTQDRSFGAGQFSLSETTDLQIWHRCEFTHATFGLGVDSSWQDSIYTQVMIWSIDPNIAAFDTVLATSGTFDQTLISNQTFISNGQTSIILPADENFLIDGATNQRQVTVGAFRQLHTPAIPGTRALNYVIDINNQADTSAIVTEYTATGLATTSGGTAFKITVDTANSTGGVVEGYHITAVGSGTAAVHAMHAGPGVAPIEHESGAFGNIDTAFTYDDSGASFADVTAAFGSGSINTSLWDEDNDLVYIGEDATFSALSFILDTPSSGPGIKPEFEFWNGSIWSSFGPFDGTNGMRVNGTITWSVVDLSGWTTTSVDGTSKYWIRIRRTSNSLTTPPIEELVQRTSTFQYSWDADGNVNVSTLIAADSLTVSGIPVNIGPGGGGTSDHAALSNLDYASAAHTGFASEAELLTVSGHLQSEIGTGDSRVKFTEAVAFSEKTFEHNLGDEHVSFTAYDFQGRMLNGVESVISSGINHTTVSQLPSASGVYVFDIASGQPGISGTEGTTGPAGSDGSDGSGSSYVETLVIDQAEHLINHNLGTLYPGFYAHETADASLLMGVDSVVASGTSHSVVTFAPGTISNTVRLTFFTF